MALPFGLRNTAATTSHLVAQRMILSPTNNEFRGMIERVKESLHGLLMEEPRSYSGYDSSRGAITPPENVSWRVPPRDMSKASPRRRLP